MASLTVRTPDGKSRTVTLLKRLTSIGRGSDADIQVGDASVPDSALHVLFDGTRYNLGSHGTSFLVNGKKKSEHVLTADDVVRIGETELTFSPVTASNTPSEPALVNIQRPNRSDPLSPENATAELPGVANRELALMQRLTQFSEKLLERYDVEGLLKLLMDELIEVTRADKGFLILLENNEMHVKVARNVSGEDLQDAVERVSDSIIAKVVQSKKPLILSDALDNPEFNRSESVVNLRLLSVLCAPLMYKGELFGVIYLGNDRLANRFEQRSLDVLTIFSAQASLLIQNAMLVNELKLDNTELRKKLEDVRFGEIVGTCASMQDVFKRLMKIAGTDISVLITGETGTGKELIAQEIHRRSPRVNGPFITINCGAIPENLLESELFGHTKGAFTGAVVTKIGKFQAANGGTLFLDEIGELPLQLQVKLLRALQEKIVHKVGDNRGEAVDIRIVAATNRVLEDEVKKGTFREDLYYRLNVVTLRLPPLRERGDDIVMLAKFFVQKYAQEFSSKARGLTPAATVAMKKFGWPGNIRELENRIKKAIVLAEKPLLGPDELDLHPDAFEKVLPLANAKEEFQKEYINKILERNNGNRTKTAKDLGVDPRTVFRHLEKQEAERTGRVFTESDVGPLDAEEETL